MNKIARWTSLILVAACVVGPAAIAPVSAGASGAENEYDLTLPGSGGNSSAPDTPTTVSDSSSDSGGFPVLVLILAVAAAVAVGLAIWRLRTQRAMDEMDDEPGPGDSV